MKRVTEKNNTKYKNSLEIKTREGINKIILDKHGVEKFYCQVCKKRYVIGKMSLRGYRMPYCCKKCHRKYLKEKREREKIEKRNKKKPHSEKTMSMTSGDAIRCPRQDDVYHPSRAQGICRLWQKRRFIGGR